MLTPEEEDVIVHKGTEAPFTDEHEELGKSAHRYAKRRAFDA
jgi:hypothetical protein